MRWGVVSFVAMVASTLQAAACPNVDNAVALVAKDTAAPKAFITYDQPPISTPFEMIVEFCGVPGDHPMNMQFAAVMPAHQHGMNYRAEVSEMGNQSYRVSNVVFHMPGLWEVRIDAEAAGESYAYSAEVQVE